jgi:hypothetical protein
VDEKPSIEALEPHTALRNSWQLVGG